jgi:Holliday junction resolvase-like predicted endonuclease
MGMFEPRIKEISISEKELEDFVVKNPEVVEEGMSILGRQIRTDSGPLDILAVDEDGVLTVIELKNKADDEQLDQGLRYYDWARTNIPWIARFFEKVDVRQEPRLILIAPAFSENLQKVAKYVKVSIDLYEYIAIQLPNGEKTILCRWVETKKIPPLTEIPTKEGNLNYIEDEKVRQLCAECLKGFEDRGIEVRPIEDFWFSIWYKGKRFMYLGCKKRFFVCQIQRPDGSWTERIRISEREDWEKTFKDQILPVLQSIDSEETA